MVGGREGITRGINYFLFTDLYVTFVLATDTCPGGQMTGYEQIPGRVSVEHGVTILRLNQVLISYVRLLEVEQLTCHQDIFQLGHIIYTYLHEYLPTYTTIRIYTNIYLHEYLPTNSSIHPYMIKLVSVSMVCVFVCLPSSCVSAKIDKSKIE